MTTDIEAKKNLEALVANAVSVQKLADILGISQPLLSYHKNKHINEQRDRLPARIALVVEQLTGGKIKASELAQVTFAHL